MSTSDVDKLRKDVRLVAFDLGGVLLELRDPVSTFGLDISGEEFFQRWIACRAVREFERGGSDAATFAQAVVSELSFDLSASEFLRRFDAWPKRLYPGTLRMLDCVPPWIGRALLSNINAAHWARSDISGPLEGRFDQQFLSFRTGILKPDEEAFLHVADAFGLRPGEVLFFDDHPANVAAATATGMHARLAAGPEQAQRLLGELWPEGGIAREVRGNPAG